MLHAAAMLTGLFIVWLLLTQRWTTSAEFAFAGLAALACVLMAARFGGLGRTGPFARAPQSLLLVIGRAGAVVRGALATMRASIAADVTLKPALVRLKWRVMDADARAAVADALSAAPSVVVVETDADSVLLHVLNEDAAGAAEFGRVESRAAAAAGGSVGR